MAATMQAKVRSAPNEELIQQVEEALYRYDPIRSTDAPIRVSANADGEVTLTGIVRTRTTKAMAETVARRVRGVTAVNNELVADTDIESSVALEFAMNERLRKAGGIIRVKSILGEVYLAGDVAADSVEEAEELKQLAEELAEGVPSVTHVINSIVARERGQAVTAVVEEEETGGLTAAQEAELLELRDRREVWAERAATSE